MEGRRTGGLVCKEGFTLSILCTPLEGDPVLPGDALSSLLHSVAHLGLCQAGHRPLQQPCYVLAGCQHQPAQCTSFHLSLTPITPLTLTSWS